MSKWIVTGLYAFVVLVAMVVAFNALGPVADIAAKSFIAGLMTVFAAVEIADAWRDG